MGGGRLTNAFGVFHWEAWGEQTVVTIQSDMLAKGHCGELQCILEGHPKGLGTSRKATLALNLQKSACEIFGAKDKEENLKLQN